ncbi:hypothetical protein POM88_052184 [Heracleum sosnowskyi]|uniref:Subtilisin-like protease n=1 Tax=Heracleum sosnowskyi TaxID=360622 RepID=A0AAD8GT83_9APIA|nr:hypothetical protein POM88_052184 [Heracleum sosnowskyi]
MGAATATPLCVFLSLILLSLLHTLTFAREKHSYVVYMGAHSHGKSVSSADLDRVTETHYKFLQSFLARTEEAKDAIFYSYTRHINGFAARLDDEEAAKIARHPNVVSIFPNRGRKLHTTRSWGFMGLEDDGVIRPSSIWDKARLGEDTIIGNLDTGVWPESASFGDEGLGPVPSKWKGICQNDVDPRFHCNRKLVGARYFNKGYAAVVGSLDPSYDSPRDTEGHGSHTLSTAGGSFVPGANVFGYGNGTAKGGSPKARVAAYKVCWPPEGGNECFDADILAAFDVAIDDGVDVLSVSLGGDAVGFFNDSVAIGSFHAVKHGIFVVCSAGNSGPNAGTVANVSPWQFTVGASTMDRQFPSYVTLGNKIQFKGESLSEEGLPTKKFYPVIRSKDAKAADAYEEDAEHCKAESLDSDKVKGKILVCLRGDNARVDKGQQALSAGAVAMILANNDLSGNEIIADPHVLPASHITYSDGLAVYQYIKSTKSPVAYLTRPTTQFGTKPAPFMAAFSSTGPNLVTPEILKPDITAPGVSIIAAYTREQGPTNQQFDKRRVLFNAASGTSMSCPHVSGIAGLLKTLYPTWSPAAIRSAMMTTARTQDNKLHAMTNASHLKASPFSYGSGHVQPNRAMDPGLVYDLTVDDYLTFLCSLNYNQSQITLFSEEPYSCPEKIILTDFNYPSITVPNLNGSITVTRTVKNVGSPVFKFLLKHSYVVYMGAHSHGKRVSSADLDRVTESHYMFLQSFLEKHINGFSATLDDEAAARLAKHPDVVSVFLNKGRQLHTTRKLVGARYFNKGYAALVGALDSFYDSPRDTVGHGSHTLSTAGGSFVPGANVFGFGNGTAKGGSAKARVAAYKVCWPPRVIMNAVMHINVAPWQFTVGASTMDRQFPSYVALGAT